MLYKGQIVASGSPSEIITSDHPQLREFLEHSGVNVATAEVRR